MKKKLKYLLACFFIVLFTFSIVPKEFQNDTFYVIALGDYILDNGVDNIDHYSWHNNLEYKYPHWLFDVINAKIYRSFQLDGIYIFVCIVSSIFMLVIFGLMIKKNISFNLAFISTIIVSYMMKGAYTARGEVVSYLLVLLEIPLIESFLKNKNKFSVLRIVFCFMYYC